MAANRELRESRLAAKVTLNFKRRLWDECGLCGLPGTFERAWPTKAQGLRAILMIRVYPDWRNRQIARLKFEMASVP